MSHTIQHDPERDVLAKDFGAVPDNPSDQAEALRAAIRFAAEKGSTRILLEPGKYYLRSFVTDERMGSSEWRHRHLWLQEISNVTIEGATDGEGRPATWLIGCHEGENEQYLPSILWADRCCGLQLRNLKFSREPAYSSAGVITYKCADYIEVDVFEGNPYVDGMACYCANRFDLKEAALLGESVTYGQGAGVLWRKVEGGSGRRLRLDSSYVAAQVHVGEGLCWHFGANTEFQLQFKECKQLQLENLHTVSANGFAMQTEGCNGVTASRIRFQPEGNLLFTAPRDAWKIYKCSGDFQIEHMFVQGVRMDGQNMHSTFLLVDRAMDDHTLRLWAKWSYAPLQSGTELCFYSGPEKQRHIIRSWRSDGKGNDGHYYIVESDQPVTLPVTEQTHAVAVCWELQSYTIRHSEFRNIAGCGHIVKHSNVTIEDVLYSNLMNAGIIIGAEWTGFYEGGHPENINIRSCTFDRCGYTQRCGTMGGIGIRTEGLSGFYNREIRIEDCSFHRLPIGVDVHHAEDVCISGNRFNEVELLYRLDPETTRRVRIEDNQAKG